jgi:dTDP-4-amino-4,6-dideoxygalactose transaminase
MKVPLLDLQAQYQSIRQEMDASVNNVLNSQKGILGPEVAELEKRIAAFCRSKHAVAVASGTDALLISLMALNVEAYDAVITTPFTFFATAGSIDRLGARTLFVDIDPVTFNISPDALRNFLKNECAQEGKGVVHTKSKTRVKALMPVHLYGQCADMGQIMKIAKEWNLPVIEDACQAIGSEFEGKSAGTIGDFGSLSFFPSKNLGGLGDGGMVLTQNDDVAAAVRILRVHGSEPKYYHKVVGINSRLDTLQAALLLAKLPHLHGWTEARRKNAARYDEALKGFSEITTPKQDARGRHVFNQYCIRAKDRDMLRKFLQDAEVGTEIYYPLPLHKQECFKGLGYKDGDFPESERASRETLALPVYPELKEDQLNFVVETIKKFYRQK